MKKCILTAMMMFLICCSLLSGCSQNSGIENADDTGDVGDFGSIVDVSNFTFEELPVCTIDSYLEYTESNDICSVYNVTFTPNKIRLYIQFNNFTQALKDVILTFQVGSRKIEYSISYVFGLLSYEIVLDRGCAEAFKLVEITGIPCDVMLSASSDFKFPFVKTGYNTLQYVGYGHVFIFDSCYNIINDLELHGFGTKLLNQGSKYYAGVID